MGNELSEYVESKIENLKNANPAKVVVKYGKIGKDGITKEFIIPHIVKHNKNATQINPVADPADPAALLDLEDLVHGLLLGTFHSHAPGVKVT